MKKRAALLLLLPALGVMMAGCSPKETLKSALRKGKEIVKTGVEKTVEALDNFFEESNPDKQEKEEKEEQKTTSETEQGQGEGSESQEASYFVELQ